MGDIALGRTGLTAEKNGFGALPVQRRTMEDAVRILRRAYDGGVRFFDTARGYTDSEEKLGAALHDVRDTIIIASKTHAKNVAAFWKDLDTSLTKLRTDHIDIHQFHNPPVLFRPGDGSGMYEAALEAQRQGKIRHIGITNHSLAIAREAVASGLYASLQYPFSYLSTEEEVALVHDAHAAGVLFIAMKALSGGLITDFRAANAYLAQFPGVVPIWGIQRDEEAEELVECVAKTPEMTAERQASIEKDRAELQGEFCRGCNYCQPCPANIEIFMAARMSLFIRRSPMSQRLHDLMAKVPGCIECGACKTRCPYGLDIPNLIKKNYEDFLQYTAVK
jgi:aryl-alcohol dehydrogenase-like predicted oxidoreductase